MNPLSTFKSISKVVKISIINRIMAYIFSSGIVLGYFYNSSDMLIWAFFFLTFLVAPIAFIIILILGESYLKTESRILLVEAVLVGAWLPLMSFPLLPMVALMTAIVIGNGFIGGVKQLLKGIAAFAVSAIFIGMWTDYRYDPIANTASSVFSIVYLFILISSISCFQNRTLTYMKSKYNILGYSHKVFEKATEIQATLNNFKNTEDIFEHIKKAILSQFSFDTMIIYLVDHENQVIKPFRIYSDYLDQSKQELIHKIDYILDERETLMGFVIQSNAPAFDNVVSINKILVGDRKLFELTTLKSMCILPLTAYGKVIGCVGLYSHRTGKISEQDTLVIANFTQALSIVIDKAQFSENYNYLKNDYSTMKRTYDDLKSTLESSTNDLNEKNIIIDSLKSKLNKYVPEPISNSILQDKKQATKLERRKLCIAVVDLGCLEELSKESNFEYYNNVFHDYLHVVSNIVYKHKEAVVYKIIDAKVIIAFGIKGELTDHENTLAAIKSCTDIREDLTQQLRRWGEKGVVKNIGFRASVYIGYCAIGFMDGDNIIEYLITGDEFHNGHDLINFAQDNIIVSSEVKELLEKEYAFIKGKEIKIVKNIRYYVLLSTLDEFKETINLNIPGFELKVDLAKINTIEEAREILKAIDKAEIMLGRF